MKAFIRLFLGLIFATAAWTVSPVLAQAASVYETGGNIYLTGSGQYVDGGYFSANDSLNVVVFDTTARDPIQRYYVGGNGSFSVSNLNCNKVFYYENTSGRIVNSATISPNNNITRDNTGGNFKQITCSGGGGGGRYYGDGSIHVDGSVVRISPYSRTFQYNRTLTLVNDSTVDLDYTNINAVVFDGQSFLKRVALFNGNTSFNTTEAPCGSRWYYEVAGSYYYNNNYYNSGQIVNSATLTPGNGVRRDNSQGNFELVNCSGGGYSNPSTVYYVSYLNLIQLTPQSDRVTLINGNTMSVAPSSLEAVIFSPSGNSPLNILPLGASYTFTRSAIYSDRVWYYRLRYGGTIINSGTITPGSCVSRDSTGGNFRVSC